MSGMVTRFTLVAATVTLLSGCGGRTQVAKPLATARDEWSSALYVATQESSAGRHAVADRALADYATRFPASSDAPEANYWRALYKLDPANTTATPHDAAVLLDAYLASPVIARRTEAQTLRRLVAAAESRSTGVAPSNLAAPVVPKADDKVKDDEIARLKEELGRANAELERVRRRLAQPKP